jgi:Rrf2 family nitric oxide-sensitive transcriptional repressor
LQLSAYTDYSLRVLTYLAVNGGEKSSIQEIADAYGISQNHLVKVVHQLGKLGYVETTRGRGGGIRLGKAPRDIRLGDVARHMEPHFNLVECFDPESNSCPISSACNLRLYIHEAREAFFAVLQSHTLADVVEKEAALKGLLGVR